jgi:hypothetical protein
MKKNIMTSIMIINIKIISDILFNASFIIVVIVDIT